MADDYDNTDEIANLSDDELRLLVRTELKANKAIDADDITIHVREGRVTIAGRVGTEEELRVADHILTDLIGLEDVNNELVVDEIRRAESPEAIDEHLADEEVHAGVLLGDVLVPLDPEAEHIVDDRNLNPAGTHEVGEAIEQAEPWIPPEGPTPEGIGGQDMPRHGRNAQH
jgi:hypothetical protein